MRDRVNILRENISLKKVILLGPYAEDRYTAASDIDILIVYKGDKSIDVYGVAWDITNISEIESHDISFRRLPKNVGGRKFLYQEC